MLVPQDGVTHDRNGQATVLSSGADNKVALQTVSASRTLGTSWVVEGGLKDGDRVIVAGVQWVQPGMLVTQSRRDLPRRDPSPSRATASADSDAAMASSSSTGRSSRSSSRS